MEARLNRRLPRHGRKCNDLRDFGVIPG